VVPRALKKTGWGLSWWENLTPLAGCMGRQKQPQSAGCQDIRGGRVRLAPVPAAVPPPAPASVVEPVAVLGVTAPTRRCTRSVYFRPLHTYCVQLTSKYRTSKYRRAPGWLTTVLRHEYFPAVSILLVVVLFWTLALFGGLTLLHTPHSALVTLGWLYLMLFLIVASAVAGFFAVTDIARRLGRRRASRADR
jgi:hypothetical protein